ncbi:MAG: hypothetical protein ACK6CU_12220 [Deltaproteobacteria bacterium]|jgi:hypothetical protein
MSRRFALALGLWAAASGCGEEAPAPTVPPPPALPPLREAPPTPPCEALCDRVAVCDLAELGTRLACVRRCQVRARGDVELLECLERSSPDGAPHCDLARRCTERHLERVERPSPVVPEGERLEAQALGPEVQLSLESRLVSAGRYELVLLLRGRGQWDGGLGGLDAGAPLDAPLDAGEFDGGLQAPDLWLRVGAFSSDGRLPLLRLDPRRGDDDETLLFEQSSQAGGTVDRYRVRHVGDELRIEHAFEQRGPDPAGQLGSDFEAQLRIGLSAGARVTAARELVP